MARGGQDVCGEVEIEIKKELSQVVYPSRRPECCIYRVPKRLRKVNEDAYTPKLISIGPLHYRNQELRDNMEMQKLIYLKEFCNPPTNKSLKDLARIVEDNEAKIRRCYEEISELSSKEYVRMILLDAIFIIELFLRAAEQNEEDHILNTTWLGNNIRQDLILLENQLPLFILEELFNKSSNISTRISFLQLACAYFYLDYSQIFPVKKEVKHFIDLRRYFLCPSNLKSGESWNYRRELRYSTTKLDEVGVKFKAVFRQQLNIRFNKNPWLEWYPWLNCSWILSSLPCLKYMFPSLVCMQPFLELHPIIVGDSSESFFRNVMAFEQCYYPLEAYVCNYFVLLDQLIDSDKDVELLVHNNIILNGLGSNDALATLINKIGLEISVANSCYQELNHKLNEHYEGFWNRTMATLTSVYFRDIWRGTTTVVGLIVLVINIWDFIKPFVL